MFHPELRQPGTRNSAIKIKKSILAIDAAPAATPVNPKIAATIAITRKVADHFNITINFIVHYSIKITVPLHSTVGMGTKVTFLSKNYPVRGITCALTLVSDNSSGNNG
jgi:hypothetical protein